MDPGYYGSGSRISATDNTTLTLALPCEAGFYCTEGGRYECGGAGVYCPVLSYSPLTVSPGWYTTGGSSSDTRVDQKACPAGSYCSGGEKFACAAGSYGETPLQRDVECSGMCDVGYWCEEGSTDPQQHECGEGLPASGVLKSAVYCPQGSTAPAKVSNGFYTVPVAKAAVGIAVKEETCEPGYWCEQGVKTACGSIGVYCAARSAAPEAVDEGWFSVGGTVATRQAVQICPAGSYCTGGEKRLCKAGFFGNATGASTVGCTGPCDEGFVCAAGSTAKDDASNQCLAGYYCPSRTSSTEKDCGDASKFCPSGSFSPIAVTVGHYSSPLEVDVARRQAEQPCEPGYACTAGVRSPCTSEATDGAAKMDAYYCLGGVRNAVGVGNYSSGGGERGLAWRQVVCEPGFYCIEGTRTECLKGTYGATPGLASAGCSDGCDAGTYGDRGGLAVSTCVNKCSPGYYCEKGSVSPEAKTCGNTHLFCPAGSAAPSPVAQGFYTTPIGCGSTCVNEAGSAGGYFSLAGQQFTCPRGLGNTTTGYFISEEEPIGFDSGVVWPGLALQGFLGGASTFAASTAPADAAAWLDFTLDATQGTVKLKRRLSFQDGETRTLGVTITYEEPVGKVTYSARCDVVVTVEDRNQPPVLDDATFDVDENVASGTVVGTVVARDTDTKVFTYQIEHTTPPSWAGVVDLKDPLGGTLVVKDGARLDFEALADAQYRIVLNVSVNDMRPRDAITSYAEVTVRVKDVNDVVLAPKLDGAAPANKHRTGGNDVVCFVGSGFAELGGVKAGGAWAVSATYASPRQAEWAPGGGQAYAATGCLVTKVNKEVCCTTTEGIGADLSWEVLLALPPNVKAAAEAAGVNDNNRVEVGGKTSYAPPSIVALSNAVGMRTKGDDVVEVTGDNLGPKDTEVVAT